MAKASNVERQWYVIDAENQVLGRLASQIAAMLRNKLQGLEIRGVRSWF